MNASRIAKLFGLPYKRVYLALEGIRTPYSRIKREDEIASYPVVESYTKEEIKKLFMEHFQRKYDNYNKGRF